MKATLASSILRAFTFCSQLTNITIPKTVTLIDSTAFSGTGLRQIYFAGNAPGPGSDLTVFSTTPSSLVGYYLPGTTGWGANVFDGIPVLPWNPQASNVRIFKDEINFDITGPTNLSIVIEACTNLSNPVWQPLYTNLLDASGASSFVDPQTGNYPVRYYRFRSP